MNGFFRPECVNCQEEDLQTRVRIDAPTRQTQMLNGCRGCVGPRCTDRVEFHANFVDWATDVRSKRPDIKYCAPAWGWDWPNHPIHSRWFDGRNALACAVQTGNEDITKLLLAEHSDVLATTYGGDTMLHVAARFEQEQCLYTLLSHCMERIPIVNPWSGRVSSYMPLDDLRNVLIHCELDVKATKQESCASHGQRSISPTPKEGAGYSAYKDRCPCRSAYFVSPLNKDFADICGSLKNTFIPYEQCCGRILKEHQFVEKPRAAVDDNTDLLNTTGASQTDLPAKIERFAEAEKANNVDRSGVSARTSALSALSLFLHMRNEMGRTPLHAAARMDRDQITKGLIALGCNPADRDRFGMSALQMMVENIPSMAMTALDQYAKIDRASRRKMFYLSELENTDVEYIFDWECRGLGDGPPGVHVVRNIQPVSPRDYAMPLPRTMLQEIVDHKRRVLTTHPVIEQLVEMKWEVFAKKYHYFNMGLYAIFLMLWTVSAYLSPIYGGRHCENRSDYTWERILTVSLAIVLTAYYIKQEIEDTQLAKTFIEYYARMQIEILSNKNWGAAYVSYWNPNDYKKAIEDLGEAQQSSRAYTDDKSNLIDLVALTCLPVSEIIQIITALSLHQGEMGSEPHAASQVSATFLSIGLVAAFLNLLKFTRAFSFWGSFMATLGRMFVDTMQFGALFLSVWIPFTIIFMLFLSNATEEAWYEGASFDTFGWAFFSMFKLTMVDGGGAWQDTTQGAVLYFAWLTLSAIVFLNLFIAMMGQSFSDIYDQSKKVASFEKARVVCSCESSVAGSSTKWSMAPWSGALDKLAVDWLTPESGDTGRFSETPFDDEDEEELDSIASMRTKLFLITTQIRENGEETQGILRALQENMSQMQAQVAPQHGAHWSEFANTRQSYGPAQGVVSPNRAQPYGPTDRNYNAHQSYYPSQSQA